MSSGKSSNITRRNALKHAAGTLAAGAAIAVTAGTAAAATTIPVHLYYRPGCYSAYLDAPDAIEALSDQVEFTLDPQFDGSWTGSGWGCTVNSFENWIESNEHPSDGHVYVLINDCTSLGASTVTSDEPAYCVVDRDPASDFSKSDTFHNMVIHEVAHVLGMNELSFHGHTAGGIVESTYVHYKTPMLTTYDANDCYYSNINCWTDDDLCVAAGTDAYGLTDYITSCTESQLNSYVAGEF